MASTNDTDDGCSDVADATGVTDPRESDVLCGRGGAALRHPGNQTYRRLVNLNKGLYITCLKTEKLKISRSIVAAIREQRGRFLEKDSKDGTWYDIGDKKAIEKTSQALREGQPKLRQKIVEMGGAAALEGQFEYYPSQSGMASGGGYDQQYDQHQQVANQLLEERHAAAVAAAQAASMRQMDIRSMRPPPPDPMKQDLHAEMFQRLSLRNLNVEDELSASIQQQRARLRAGMGLNPNQNQNQRPQELRVGESNLSLMSDFSGFSSAATGLGMTNQSLLSMESGSYRRPYGASPQTSQQFLQHTGEMSVGGGSSSMGGGSMGGASYSGSTSTTISSSGQIFGNHTGSAMPGHTFGNHTGNGMSSPQYGSDQRPQQQYFPHQTPSSSQTTSSARDPRYQEKLANLDRRIVFAKMKYGVPPTSAAGSSMGPPKPLGSSNHGGLPSMSQHSVGDGMPDIHMVESTMSLYSTMSNMTDGNNAKTAPVVKRSVDNKDIPFRPYQPEIVQVLDHSRDIHWGGGGLGLGLGLGGGSRHSVMSGLSRIDDSSMGDSVFSDIKKNTSTRSIAMSEISVLDMQERDNEDDSSDTGFDHSAETLHVEQRKTQSTVEYDL